MTFLNAILAFGALAFTVPLIIHLLHRTKYRTVDWGAMHLLQSTMRVNSKRLQWQQFLLLLLRCLLPMLLAFAMARPMVQSWLSAGVGEPIAIAVVLDDSLSMQSMDGMGETRWVKGLKTIESILADIPRGSSVAFVLGGQKARLANATDVGNALKLIGEWKSSKNYAGTFSIEESTTLGLQWLGTAAQTRRQLLFVSDFQSNDWGSSESTTARVKAMLDQQTIRPEVACFSVLELSQETDEIDNLSVESLEVSPRIITKSLDAVLTATVRNHGNTVRENVRVRFRVDGAEIYQQSVTIPARSILTLRTMWSPTTAKESLAQVNIEQSDRLIADNEFLRVISVVEPISVLLVDGDRRSEPMQSETDFLRLALSPFSVVGQTKGDPFRCKTISPSEWNESTLKGYSLVAICNVPELSTQQQSWLKTFVESGNGLLVFPGNRMSIESWQRMPTIASGGIRPADFAPIKKVIPSEESDAKVAIDTQSIAFEPLAEMPKPSLTALSSLEIQSFLPMTAIENNNTSVVAKLTTGEPWIIRSSLGKGVSLWFSMACDDDDNNLPTKPVFLPLMQRLALHVAAPNPSVSSIAPGQVWTLTPPPSLRENSSVQLRVYDTQNREHTVENRIWSDTRFAGLYEAKWTAADSTQSTYAVVNPRLSGASSIEESALIPVEKTVLDNELIPWKAKWFGSTQSFLDSMQREWVGREIWSWLWIGVIFCFLGEMLLEQRFLPRAGRGSTISTQSSRGGPR